MLCSAVLILSAKHQRYCLVFIRTFSQELSYISSDMKAILLTLCTLYYVFVTWARSVGGTGWFVCGLCFTYSMSGFGEVEGFIRLSTYINQAQILDEEDFNYFS